MTESVKIENYEEMCKNFSEILKNEDVILMRSLALSELNKLSRQTELIQSLSLESIFTEFLALCFNLFMNSDDVEKCVDILLLANFSRVKLEKYGFKEILEKLAEIPKFSTLANDLKTSFGLGKKKSTKRVSWQDDRNEIRYFAKEEENVEFKHGGYKDMDKFEAVAWKNESKKELENQLHWFTPIKYRKAGKNETDESKEQALREAKSFLLQNGNPKMEFNPIDLNHTRERTKTVALSLYNNNFKNIVGDILKIERNSNGKKEKISEEEFYKNPEKFLSRN